MASNGAPGFALLKEQLPAIQKELADKGLDGWLLYNLRVRNGVAASLLGLGEMSRRYFVMIPAQGEPHALTHGIEQIPWQAWPWGSSSYVGWQVLDEAMKSLIGGRRRLAMEVSDRDAVPIVDLVPSGVVEMIRGHGVEVVSSGDLITKFYSRWTPGQVTSHYKAAGALVGAVNATFQRLAGQVRAGRTPLEEEVRQWVVAELTARGSAVGADSIAARGVNAANPHYETTNGGDTFRKGDVVLIDLWAKESEDAVFADQTWMAFLGATVPARAAELFDIVCRARDAAVAFVRTAWHEGRTIQGYEVDDVARAVIDRAGYGEYFIHRTGHSIDRATHGMGPNMDNLETHETRTLLEGVGFSIEPGIYIPGEIGVRTEINVYIGANGPDVTPGEPQHVMRALPVE
ncbi:MAG: M24 family metallopeptidase [Longimicrobiales bacterium]